MCATFIGSKPSTVLSIAKVVSEILNLTLLDLQFLVEDVSLALLTNVTIRHIRGACISINAGYNSFAPYESQFPALLTFFDFICARTRHMYSSGVGRGGRPSLGVGLLCPSTEIESTEQLVKSFQVKCSVELELNSWLTYIA